MNGYDVIDVLSNHIGDWIQGRQEVYYLNSNEGEQSKEQQYYIAKNQEMAVGYVKNRTFNAFTMRTSQDPSSKCMQLIQGDAPSVSTILQDFNNLPWDRDKLEIQGLKYNTDYLVHWFSFRNGYYMSSNCFNTSITGNATLHHPQLYVHPDAINAGYPLSPVLWYVIEQNNCNNYTATSDIDELNLTQEKISFQEIIGSTESPGYLEIFPNPVKQDLNIRSDASIGQIKIVNSSNQTVIDLFLNESNGTINVSSLASGIYTLIHTPTGLVYKIVRL